MTPRPARGPRPPARPHRRAPTVTRSGRGQHDVAGALGADVGLTLLETLIVLAVIAVAAGATMLSLSPRRGDPTEVEAKLLAQAVQAAADGALATGTATSLVVDGGGYAAGGAPRHALPPGIALADLAAPVLPLDLVAGRPFDLTIARGGERWTVTFDGLRAVAAPATPA